MAYKLPRIEAAIQMVDNVSAVMRGVRNSIEATNGPVNQLRNSLASLSREAGMANLAKSAGALHSKLGGVADGFGRSVDRARGVLLGGAGAIAATGLFLKTTADAADAVVDTSREVGVATGMLQKFRYVAQLSGSSVEEADKGLARFAKGLSAARAGTGEALAPLQAMGVRLKDAAGKARPMESVLLDISDALAKIPNEQDRLRVSSSLFGKGNQKLVLGLSQGSKALRGIFQEYQRLGGPISDEDLNKGAEFNDTMDRLKFASGGLAATFAGQLFPAVTQLVTRVTEWAAANRDNIAAFGKFVAAKLPEVLDTLGKSFSNLVRQATPVARVVWAIMEAVGPLQVVLGGLAVFVAGPFVLSFISAVPALLNFGKTLFSTGRLIVAALPTLATLSAFITGSVVPAIYAMGTALLTTPVGWIVGGLALVAGAAFLLWKNWDKVSTFMVAAWGKVSSFLDTSIGRILAVFVFPFVGIPLLIVKHWSTIAPFLLNLWDGIVSALGPAVSALWGAFVSPLIRAAGVIRKAWDPLRTFFSGLWDGIGSAFQGFVDLMGTLWRSLNALVANGAGLLSKTLQGIPLVGGLLSKGAAFFQGAPAAPAAAGSPATTGATGAVRTNTENTSSTVLQRSTLDVNFNNLPRGARVSEVQGNAPVSVSTGLAFQGAF